MNKSHFFSAATLAILSGPAIAHPGHPHLFGHAGPIAVVVLCAALLLGVWRIRAMRRRRSES